MLVNWKRPPDDWIKVNVDGASNQISGCIGAGGLFRAHNGAWLVGFVYNIGKGHPLLAEAWAALKGIQIALGKGYTKQTLNLMPLSKVTHCYREANFCADFFAKMELSASLGLKLLDIPPPGMLSLVETFFPVFYFLYYQKK